MIKTLEKIKEILEDNVDLDVQKYFIDDPNLVPLDSLPIIAIAPVSTDIDIMDNNRDRFSYDIDVILIINAKREIEKYDQEMVGTRKLTEAMEEINSSDQIKAGTILHTLRQNDRLGDNWYIDNVSSIDYGIRQRPEQIVTKEASCRITVHRIFNRPTS